MKIPVGRATLAMTFIEFAVVGSVIILLLLCILPQLGGSRKLPTMVCVSNMKQIVLAMRMWSNDHNGLLPHRVPVNEGGLKDPGTNYLQTSGSNAFDPTLRSNVWVYYSILSNELNTPKILVCPAERNERNRAVSWVRGSNALASPQFQNNAVSYTIGLDADLNPGGGPPDIGAAARQVIVTDRHLNDNGVDSRCASGLGLAKVIKQTPNGTNRVVDAAWKKKPKAHEGKGSVALLDGSANHQVTSKQVQDLLAAQPSDNGSLHFLYP